MNKKLKFGKGVVIVIIALIIITYMVFVGTLYLIDGRMLTTLLLTGALVLLLAMCAFGLQRLKGTDHHFKSRIFGERILLPVFIILCLVAMVPFSHFFTIHKHGNEITCELTTVLDKSKKMLNEYFDYTKKRKRIYIRHLNRAQINNNMNKNMGGSNIVENIPCDFNVDNMSQMMKNNQIIEEDRLLLDASEWFDSAANEDVTVWNLFMLDKIKNIGEIIELCHGQMEENSKHLLPVEKGETSVFNNTNIQEIRQHLNNIHAISTRPVFPGPLALLTGLACMPMLFLPYYLQQRHTRSRESLFGKGHNRPVNIDHDYNNIHRIRLVNDISIPKAMVERQPQSRLNQLRENITNSERPFDVTIDLLNNGTITPEELLDLLHHDCNMLDAATVTKCMEAGIFTREQLLEGHEYLEGFVNMLGTPLADILPVGKHIEYLAEGSTEFYFWGIPSSGKTCALGLVLNAAMEKSVINDLTVNGECQGFDYMIELMNVFRGRDTYCVLPARTPVDTNYAIELNMTDYRNHVHPITLIDMAGELFCHLYWKNNNITDNINNHQEAAFQSFENILQGHRTSNRKFHFFIIEYGSEKKRYKGFKQDEYLTFGLKYLEETGILRDATDGVCIIVTKYDHLFTHIGEDEDINNHLSAYLYRNYGRFIRMLRKCCKKYDIAGGIMPDPIPFTIGDVCFKNYCLINTDYAKDIVKVIMCESVGFRHDTLSKVEELLR